MSQKTDLNQFDKFKITGFCLIIFAFAPGVFMESFWSDDYSVLMDTQGVVDHVLKDARPTLAIAGSLSFSLLKSAADAWILRFLALAALLLIFHFISNRIKNSRHYNSSVVAIAIAFCLPSFQMFIHWSSAWFFLWAALAGIHSFHFWSSKQKSRKILAVLLLVLALTTYPPSALFFFSVITVTNVLNESSSSKFLSEVIQGLKLSVISGFVSILVAFSAMQIVGVSPNQRVKLITFSEIPEKISWLFSRPFVVGLRPFAIDSPTPVFALITSLPILLILLLGMRSQSRSLGELLFFRVSVIVFPLIVTLAPIVITSGNQIEFRFLSGYSWGVMSLAIFFLLREVETWFKVFNASKIQINIASFFITTVLSLVAIFSVNLHYMQLFGEPYQNKNAFLNSKISNCFKEQGKKKILILPPKEPFPTFPRLGVFSMSTDLASPWVPKPNVELLLRDRRIEVPVVYLEVRPEEMKVSRTECVIDLEEFRKSLL